MRSKCAVCGAEFEVEPGRGGSPRRYCSSKCRRAAQMRKWRADHPEAAAKRGQIDARRHREKIGAFTKVGSVGTCPTCGAKFRFAHGLQRFCSPRCQQIWNRQRVRERRQMEREKRRAEMPYRECSVCGAKFIPARLDAVCCSIKCRRALQRWQMSDCHKTRRTIEQARAFAGLPPLRHVKTYIEIKRANQASPLVAGWRGQRTGGGAGSGRVPVALQVDDSLI